MLPENGTYEREGKDRGRENKGERTYPPWFTTGEASQASSSSSSSSTSISSKYGFQDKEHGVPLLSPRSR
jgi:hypothetical protein